MSTDTDHTTDVRTDGPTAGTGVPPREASPAPTRDGTVRPRPRRGLTILAGAALVAVAITVGVVTGTFLGPATDEASGTAVTEQAALERLVRLGYVPAAALEPVTTEEAITERLRARGLVPTGSTAPPLRAAAVERTVTTSLVARGLVPPETLQPTTERGHTQVLVLKGLVPDGS